MMAWYRGNLKFLKHEKSHIISIGENPCFAHLSNVLVGMHKSLN